MAVHVDERFFQGRAGGEYKTRVVRVKVDLNAADRPTVARRDRVDANLARRSESRTRVGTSRDPDGSVDTIDRDVDGVVIGGHRERTADIDTGLAAGRHRGLRLQAATDGFDDLGRVGVGYSEQICRTDVVTHADRDQRTLARRSRGEHELTLVFQVLNLDAIAPLVFVLDLVAVWQELTAAVCPLGGACADRHECELRGESQNVVGALYSARDRSRDTETCDLEGVVAGLEGEGACSRVVSDLQHTGTDRIIDLGLDRIDEVVLLLHRRGAIVAVLRQSQADPAD